MEWYEALLLGIIQGLTEFLPVSSSGHLEISSYLLNTDTSQNLFFNMLVHIATAFSIIYVFREDIFKLIGGLIRLESEQVSFASKIILSSIPVGIIGILFEDQVEKLFTGNILLVGSMLILTSVLLFLSNYSKSDPTGKITYQKALIIGVAQAFAIMPGISRSGATIATALLLNIDKKESTRFSFLMVLVPIFGILILKIIEGFQSPEISINKDLTTAYTVGFISSLLSGVFACKLMLKIVRESKLIYFSFYCMAVGLIGVFSSCSKNEKESFSIEPILPIELIKEIALDSKPPFEFDLKSGLEMVDLEKLDDKLILDIRYASENNFMKSVFYEDARAFINKDAAPNILNASNQLNEMGYGLIIYDAYRPWFVTKMFWEGTPDDLKHFVADPSRGSVHNRGCAIDVGLYNLSDGKPVKMISGYDEFTEKAYPSYTGGTKFQREIRDELINIMSMNNFSVYEYEWWHFNYNECGSGVMNYSFKDLDSLKSIS